MGSRSVLINLLGEGGGASRALRGVGDDADRAARRVDNLDESNRRASEGSNVFSRSLESIGPAAGRAAASIGMVAAQAGAAIPAAAGLGAAVIAIAPAAAVAATALVAVGTAGAALKIGMSGVSDAVTAALDPSNPEAYAKALAKLSPNARAFVQEIHALQPALAGIKTAVQDRLFENLGASLKTTAAAVLPDLKRGLVDSAGALNGMAFNAMGAARSLAKNGVLGTAIDGATGGLKNLTKVPSQVLTAFVELAAAAAPAFGRLTKAIGNVATKASQALSGAFKSGAIGDAIDVAIGLLKQLGQVAVNVFKIVSNIFGAAQASGGGFVGTLQKITAALAEVTANPAFQAGLRAIFETMNQLATTAAPLLAQALLAIAPVFTALGPPLQLLIQQLGVALQPVIAALGPVLVAMATSFGTIVTAIAPLLPILGQLIAGILTPLAPVLAALGPAIAGIVAALRIWSVVQAALNVVLAANPIGLVVIAIGALVAGLIYAYRNSETFRNIVNGAWAAVQAAVSTAWGVIRPILSSLASFFTDTVVPAAETLATNLGQAFDSIKKTIHDAWDDIKGWLQEFADFLDTTIGPAVDGLVKGIQGIGDGAKGLSEKFSPANGPGGLGGLGAQDDGKGGGAAIGNAFNIMLNRMKTELTAFTGWANGAWGGFLDGIGSAVGTAATQIERDWSGLWDGLINTAARSVALFTAIGSKIVKEFGSALLAPWPGIQAKWNAAMQGLPMRAAKMAFDVVESIGNLPGQISAIASRMWASLPRTLSGSAAAVSQKLTALKNTIVQAFAGAPAWLRAAGQSIIDGLIAGVRSKVSALQGMLGNITSLIPSWKGPPDRDRVLLKPSGIMIMEGLGDGLAEGVQEVYAFLDKVTGKLAYLVEEGVHSSLVPIGDLGKKLRQALTKGADEITDIVKQIRGKIADAFKAKSINSGQRDDLLDYLAETNKKLQTLAKERQKIVDKIKEIQDYAKQVTQAVLSYAAITSIKGDDGAAPNGGQLVAGLQARLATIREFGGNLKKLAAAGLSKALLGQILDAGIDGGAAIAAELANGPASIIAALNTAQTQITKIAKNIGLDGADALFGSGKAMGDAFLKGLKAMEKALVDSMEALVEKLLKALSGGVDKAKGKLTELAETSKQVNQLTELVVTSTAKAAAYAPPAPKAPAPGPAAPKAPTIPAPKGGGVKNVSVSLGGVTVRERADVDMLMNASAFAARSLSF